MIIRSKKPDRFTVLPNKVLEDQKIGWGALGLLSYLLSRPDDWRVMPMQLANMRKQGRDAIYAMLAELVEHGYAEHLREKNARGGVWMIYDRPARRDLLTDTDNTDQSFIDTENPDESETIDPEKTDPEKTDPEFPTLQRTERPLKTERTQSTEVSAPPPAKKAAAKKKKKPPITAATWEAYSRAYHDRYNIDPIRNASVNAQLANFVKRVGAEDAPGVAAYFVTHPDAYYTKRGHTVGIMLSDAEKLRTEWATRKQVTGGQARKLEETSTRQSSFQNVKNELIK